MKLWPKARVRGIRFHDLRFHDLRHTTASLLMMAGVNPGAVQRILRHSDPRITTETYGHLQPDYLRSEIDRLCFGTAPANDLADLPNASNRSQPSAANSRKLLTRSAIRAIDHFRRDRLSPGTSDSTSAGWTGLEPAASGVTGRKNRVRAIRVLPEGDGFSRFPRCFGPGWLHRNRVHLHLGVRKEYGLRVVLTARRLSSGRSRECDF
jgi:hypothetical protein